MQITIRSEEYMKRPCITRMPNYTGVHRTKNDTNPLGKLDVETIFKLDDEKTKANKDEWTLMRNLIGSGEVFLKNGERLVGDYWAFITTMHGRPVIRRVRSKDSITRRIQILNRIKLKYEEGIYEGDFVVMKSQQQSPKYSWPLIFKSGVLHAITNNIEWIHVAAQNENVYYDQLHQTFVAWLNRNMRFPPNIRAGDRQKMTFRMQSIFHLRQINSKKLWKKYIQHHECRFGYLTYSKGKATFWHHAAHDGVKVIHDIDDERNALLTSVIQRRGWIDSEGNVL